MCACVPGVYENSDMKKKEHENIIGYIITNVPSQGVQTELRLKRTSVAWIS